MKGAAWKAIPVHMSCGLDAKTLIPNLTVDSRHAKLQQVLARSMHDLHRG